jgi:hypothetical protein
MNLAVDRDKRLPHDVAKEFFEKRPADAGSKTP